VETYLCRKNDGHLIRIVGPSFEIVSRWSADGIPLTIALRGVDRYFERYYKKGPRRRPVRIDFCDADVRELFDEWRRAVGLVGGAPAPEGQEASGDHVPRGPSLPAHLERVVLRLTNARVAGTLGSDADQVIDRIAQDLDRARASARGLRGEARQSLIARLADFDRELLDLARRSLPPAEEAALAREAHGELEAFRDVMPADSYRRAHAAAVDRLVRERAGLPVLLFS
jgi:hypothetical protein